MPISRRNLLHGIAAVGTAFAAGVRTVAAFAPNGLRLPLSGGPGSVLRLQNGVTIVSVKAAIAALDDTAYVQMAAKRNSDDRQEFMNQVNARMLRAIDSHANFVLLNPLRPVSEVIAHLEKNNVLVAPPIPAMEKYIRVSLGTPAEMREFWSVWDLMPAGKMEM